MSNLTVELLEGKRRRRRPEKWIARFRAIADRLLADYGTPALGNLDDPVEEIFYILLSSKTADAQYRRTHAALRAKFSTLQDLADASVTEIAQSILSGGMAYVKAERMRKIARILSDRFDGDPSGGLRKMAVDELYKFLTHLPGMGPKSALCVMMWSLKYDVFPVDVNVSRIAIRVGALKPGLKHYHYQQLLPVMIPDGRSRDLHVSLVVHGRAICLPRIPKCESCQIRDLCNFGSKKKRRSSRNKRMGPSLNADPNV